MLRSLSTSQAWRSIVPSLKLTLDKQKDNWGGRDKTKNHDQNEEISQIKYRVK